MLRIGYLTSVYARASDTFIRAEVLELRRRGHDVRTYSIRAPDAAQLTSDEVRSEHANTLYILPAHQLDAVRAALRLLFLAPARTLAALALAWRTGAPGLKARALMLAYFLEAAFLAVRLGRDGVQHLHVHLEEQPATVGMLAAALSGLSFSLAVHGPYIFRAPLAWALGAKIARARFVTCISEFTRSQCMLYAPRAHWEKLQLVRCSPGRSFLERPATPVPAAPRCVWVGRVCEEKGVPVLLAAAERLAREGLAFELVLLGDGPLLAEVRASIEAQGLSEHVQAVGWASSERVRDELVASRLLVQPSFAEGLPVVIMEALALGRPVISTFIAGIPELVETGACGWLVPAGSVNALADALRQALSASTSELERLGREGRRRVLERHHIEHEVARLEELFRRSVAADPGPSQARRGEPPQRSARAA